MAVTAELHEDPNILKLIREALVSTVDLEVHGNFYNS